MMTLSRRTLPPRNSQARKGFSLIEVMVALTLLALVLSSLAWLATYVAVRGRNNDGYAKRAAVLQMETNKFDATPLDSLKVWSTTTKTFTVNGFTYTRRLAITQASATQDSIKIVVTPSTSGIPADSAYLIRTKPNTATVLCSGC